MLFARRPHLRFAATTFAVIALVGAGLLWAVHHEEVKQAEQNVTAHARYIEHSIIRDELKPSDLAHPVTGARRRQLDWLFNQRVLADGGLRVKIYREPGGIVTYSNIHSLIGTPSDEPDELEEVMVDGHPIRDVAYLNHEGGTGKNVKALEVYVPLTLRGQTQPTGVFEIYESYAPVAAAVHSFLVPFALLLLGAVLALWAALFPLVERMVRVLDRSRAAHRSTEQELEETAEQLRQSQKMDAIGRLAGSVAHDFNNLLLAINGYSELLAADLDDPRLLRFANEIRSAGERAAGLTAQLLAFSRRQVMQPQVIDLNDCIRDIDTMLRRLIGERVRVMLDLDPALRNIEADSTQMGQVLLNLAVNARDAMAGSGLLKIATWNDGDDVILEVADTGVGMDADTQARIFEPFFTTKDVDHGTGLGLSTVYGIVAQSDGTISVRSAAGQGATFVLRFPATSKQRADDTLADAAESHGGERILVVDDEAVVRDLLAQLLRDQGYDVEVAGSAEDALSAEGSFDLLLCDVVMPDVDGTELARSIDARLVLFMSGYDQEQLAQSNVPFLQKPFGRDELTRAVRELLDAGRVRSAA